MEDNEGTVVIPAENWDNIVIPGAEIFINIIYRRADAVSEHACPRCRTVNVKRISQRREVIWFVDLMHPESLSTLIVTSFVAVIVALVSMSLRLVASSRFRMRIHCPRQRTFR